MQPYLAVALAIFKTRIVETKPASPVLFFLCIIPSNQHLLSQTLSRTPHYTCLSLASPLVFCLQSSFCMSLTHLFLLSYIFGPKFFLQEITTNFPVTLPHSLQQAFSRLVLGLERQWDWALWINSREEGP